MKATIPLLFFLCISFIIHAQSIELNIQPKQFSEIHAVKYAKNEKWLIGGTSASVNDDRDFILSKVDSLNHTQPFNNNFGYEYIESLFGDDNVFFSLTRKGSDQFIHGISQFNNSPNIFSGFRLDSNEVVNKIVQLPNGTRVIVGYRMINSEKMALLKIFSSGFSLGYEDVFTKGYYSDVIMYDDTTFMVTGSIESSSNIIGGRKYNEYYEMVGEVLPNLESDYFFKTNDGGFFLVKNKVVSKLDQDFQVVNTMDFSSYGDRIDLEFDEENIYMLFQADGEAPMILKINNSLQVENYFSIEDENFIAKDMGLSENEIGVGGILIPNFPFNETIFPYTSTSGYFKTYSKNGLSNTEVVDLEILDVKIKDHNKFSECNGIDLPETYSLNLKNIELLLVNHGSTRIIDATFFIQALGIDDCEIPTANPKYHFQQEELKLLRIEPGDTLDYRMSAFEFPQAISDTTTVKVCIWNTEVDNKKDQNLIDNYFCGELELEKLEFVTPTIIEPTEEEYLLFPNPMSTSFTLSLKERPFETTTIRFYNQQGLNIQNYRIAARAKYKVFDTSDLPSQIYFVRIKNDLIDELTKVYVHNQ